MGEQDNSGEEIDLGMIFSGLRNQYHKFLIWSYHGLQFIIRKWYLIVGIIILGVLAGLYSSNSLKKEAILQVQLNFGSTYYVYNAIDKLNNEIRDNDREFLKEVGIIQNEKLFINSVKIEPIINISDIMVKDDRVSYSSIQYLQTLFEKSDLEGSLLTSEMLLPQYKTHKITLKTTIENSSKATQALLDYLNSNKLLQEAKKIGIKSAKIQIKEYKKSISAIDDITKLHKQSTPKHSEGSSVYFSFNQLQNDNLYMLYREKNRLLSQTEKLKIDLLKYDHIVSLLNVPEFHKVKKGITNNLFFYPILFLILFFIFMQFRRLYFKAKRLIDNT